MEPNEALFHNEHTFQPNLEVTADKQIQEQEERTGRFNGIQENLEANSEFDRAGDHQNIIDTHSDEKVDSQDSKIESFKEEKVENDEEDELEISDEDVDIPDDRKD